MPSRRAERHGPLTAAALVLCGGLATAHAAVPGTAERGTSAAPAAGAAARPSVPRLLRVGLDTDRESFRVPCCQGQLAVQAGGKVLGVESQLDIEPRAEVASPTRYRLQIAALKDEGQARRLARWLGERLGEAADATFDAGADLYRVRSGAWPSRERAESMQRELRAEGVEAWIVSERGQLRDPSFHVTHAGGTTKLPGRWLWIRRSGSDGLRVAQGRFRGAILLYLNDRGRINVINELSLEDYLRGVVPKEMGPVLYSSLEALKAQTVAARTYTVRNLGEFADEGYDICATPRCQVFGGMDAEHALSDRAVEETAGQVLVHQGHLVDALYSSSCGGHTEDVEVVFPLKSHVYLRGVPCPESGVDAVSGTLALGTPLVRGVMLRLLPEPGGDGGAASAEARLRGLAALAGLPVARATLASLDRRDVRRFVGSLFDLVLDARLLTAGTEVAALLASPPSEWSEDDLRLATYLDRTGLLSAPIDGELTPAELEEMLFQLSLYLGVVESRSGSFLSRDADELLIKGREGIESLPLTDQLATFRGGEHNQRSAPLVLRPGDPVTAYLRDGDLVALAQQVDGDLAEGSPGAEVKIWHRRHTDAYLRRVVSTRYPEIDFETFEVLARGVSGRVGRIRLHGRDGRSLEVEGLAVRWTLDLPDTLFTARRLEPSGQEAGWLFTGRGHGHGVGMCQLGAYGMGLRGSGYRDILHHYYSGVSIVGLELVERSEPAAASR